MKHFLQMGSGLDVGPLALELQRQPELWNRNPIRLLPTGPHYETDDIWLRYKDEAENIASGNWSNFGDLHYPIWYPAYYALPSSRRFIFDLMTRVEGESLGGILIYRVPPGAKIHEHTDTGWHAETHDKFNITIASNPRAALVWPKDNEVCVARPGDVHWFRNTVPHAVLNEGDTDHIVMVISIITHKFKGH